MEKIKTVFSVVFASLFAWVVLLVGGLVYAMFSNTGHEAFESSQAFGGAVVVESHAVEGEEAFLRFHVDAAASLRLLLIVAAVISLGAAAVKYRIKRKPAAKLDSAKEGYVLPEMKAENIAESAANFASDSAADASSADSDELSDFERDELIKQRLAEQKSKQNS